jgi:hypothetical protein
MIRVLWLPRMAQIIEAHRLADGDAKQEPFSNTMPVAMCSVGTRCVRWGCQSASVWLCEKIDIGTVLERPRIKTCTRRSSPLPI